MPEDVRKLFSLNPLEDFRKLMELKDPLSIGIKTTTIPDSLNHKFKVLWFSVGNKCTKCLNKDMHLPNKILIQGLLCY